VNLLEALGCPFGACQNAYTSVDETVYELDVPTDGAMKPVEEALDMIAQFAHAIRYGMSTLLLISNSLGASCCWSSTA